MQLDLSLRTDHFMARFNISTIHWLNTEWNISKQKLHLWPVRKKLDIYAFWREFHSVHTYCFSETFHFRDVEVNMFHSTSKLNLKQAGVILMAELHMHWQDMFCILCIFQSHLLTVNPIKFQLTSQGFWFIYNINASDIHIIMHLLLT